MTTYIVRRLLLSVITITIVALLTFAMINALPGSVIDARLADAPQGRAEVLPKLKQQLGLDKPRPVQFAEWYLNAWRGDLGKSLWSDESVIHALKRTFPVTFQIAIMAIILGAAVAIPFGVLAAVFQDRWLDHVTRLISITALAVPDFVIGTLFIVYSLRLVGYAVPISFKSLFVDTGINLQLTGVAAVIIGLRLSGGLTRLARSSVLDVLRQDFMRTARAKGLTESRVVISHGLKNACLPVMTLLGLQFGGLLGGTVIMEQLFGIPGAGRLLLTGIQTRDFTLVQGIVLLFGTFLVLTNLIVDISYGIVDPRIRSDGS